MPFVVPFDGSPLSEAALVNARIHEVGFENLPRELQTFAQREDPPKVTAVSVIPERASYARKKGWIGEDEEFDHRVVVERLHEQVTDIAPNASFDYERTGTSAAGTIGQKLRRKARSLGASTVFVGSENAGRIATPMMSVGARVSTEQEYNVVLVRKPLPEDVNPRLKSDFYRRD
ncbi:adenine nucleotide alpha hydrolase family protein [Halocalculus aciditolerans]|uniref:Universal stress protein n=1 Tax=Halocalculus aciditolerans TaxID=1383812 RepID=A0A830FMQ8_9EURY|nr:universal stress protein [Halocalculus aciditolerans]GGL68043.1 hypothetical protein GCM10009039_27560 [Halocalculus aciditolerans]